MGVDGESGINDMDLFHGQCYYGVVCLPLLFGILCF